MTVFGGDLYGPSGSVASPYYPRHYPHNVQYVWTVTVDLASRVMATFQTMDIERSRPCVWDYVRVSLMHSLLFHVSLVYVATRNNSSYLPVSLFCSVTGVSLHRNAVR